MRTILTYKGNRTTWQTIKEQSNIKYTEVFVWVYSLITSNVLIGTFAKGLHMNLKEW